MAILYGAPPSPYVRKAMLVLAYKDVPFEFKVALPGSDDEEFRDASPLGKVPAFRTDDGFGFADSSVITAYLEKVHTDKPLYPQAPNDFARALWFEEYGDTKLMEVTAALYFQRIVGPAFFNHTTDEERVKQLIDELIPPALDYVESQMSDGWLVNDSFSIADISVMSNLLNLHRADFMIDETRWPKIAAYNSRMMKEPQVQRQLAAELEAMKMGK